MDLYDYISEALSALDSAAYEARQEGRRDLEKLLNDAFDLVDKAERQY